MRTVWRTVRIEILKESALIFKFPVVQGDDIAILDAHGLQLLPQFLRRMNSEKRLNSDTTKQKLRDAITKELYGENSTFVKELIKGFSASFRKYLQEIAQAAEIPIE